MRRPQPVHSKTHARPVAAAPPRARGHREVACRGPLARAGGPSQPGGRASGRLAPRSRAQGWRWSGRVARVTTPSPNRHRPVRVWCRITQRARRGTGARGVLTQRARRGTGARGVLTRRARRGTGARGGITRRTRRGTGARGGLTRRTGRGTGARGGLTRRARRGTGAWYRSGLCLYCHRPGPAAGVGRRGPSRAWHGPRDGLPERRGGRNRRQAHA